MPRLFVIFNVIFPGKFQEDTGAAIVPCGKDLNCGISEKITTRQTEKAKYPPKGAIQKMKPEKSDTDNNIRLKSGPARYKFFSCLLVLSALALSSCSSSSHRFELEDVAKSDVNQIMEIHLRRATELIEKLAVKMYKRNPAELAKTKDSSIKARVETIVACPSPEGHEELGFRKGTEAILLGFDREFEGDRVFAVMYGLYSMILKSYDNKCEFFFLDYLDQQKLYNSARNIEILVWRLKTRVDEQGKPLVLTNCTSGPVINISFERIFGKLISLQDTLAEIVSDRTNRTIKKVVHFTGMSFLPVGL